MLTARREGRTISQRLRLTKIVREKYTHSNVTFIPQEYRFDKVVLIPTLSVLTNFSTVLFLKEFDLLICTSFLQKLPSTVSNQIQQNPSEYLLFPDDFVTETSGKDTTAVLHYHQKLYKNIEIKVLSESNITSVLHRYPDILSSTRSIPSSFYPSQVTFQEHSKNASLQNKIGMAIKGTLVISQTNREEGEVLGMNERIRVSGTAINRGMHGDEVFVTDGTVIGISKRKQCTQVGTVYELRPLDADVNVAYIRPIDRRLPDILAVTSQHTQLGSKVLVHITDWAAASPLPRGVIYRHLGQSADMEVEIKAILEHFSISYYDETWDSILGSTFTPSFSIADAHREVEEGTRRDLRSLPICSIDPPGCTDIDDALHCIDHGDFIEVGVHIADVSSFVPVGSFIDDIARDRSTTVYFPGRRIDMLPPVLSASLCSLLPNQDRACISCVWRLSRDFEILETSIFKSLIHSKAALSYQAAHDLISNDATDSPLVGSLRMLLTISQHLRRERFGRGALELNSQEFYIDFKGKMQSKSSIPTHFLVEEFMLLANISVAKYIFGKNPEYSLLRRHPLPSQLDLDIVDCTSSKSINTSLSLLDPDRALIAKRIITRSMQQAVYFVSGESSDFYHYGLAVPIYTHFTSPIRRYPDLIVHRILSCIFKGDVAELDSFSNTVTKKRCSFINFRHRSAQNASRMVSDLFLYSSLEEKEVEGTVVAQRPDGYIVFIREFGIEEYVKCTKSYHLFDKMSLKIIKNFEKYCVDRTVTLLPC